LALLLKDNPPAEADAPAMRTFASIGLNPGGQFNPSPDLSLVADRARDMSLGEIKDQILHLAPVESGWQMIRTNIGRYGTDYMRRAAVAMGGLGANLPEDAVYPMADKDGAGQPLTGSKSYVLHFDKDQIPPVNAFWSLTAYDEKGYFIPNPLNRYAARDTALAKNPDGSVDIYLQAQSPGKAHEKNWLPTPKDAPFSVNLRMYWPKPAVLDGSYTPPAIQP